MDNSVVDGDSAARCRVVSIGSMVEEGLYPVLARFRNYLDFSADDSIIGLTDRPSEGGPLTIVLAGLEQGWSERIDRLEVGADGVYCDGSFYVYAPDSRYIDKPDVSAFVALPIEEKRRRLLRFHDIVVRLAPGLSLATLIDPVHVESARTGFERAMFSRLLEGIVAFRSGDDAGATRLLLGAGFGLTPSGDDFMCGAMYGLHAARLFGADDACPDGLATVLQPQLAACGIISRAFLGQAIANRWPRALRDAVSLLGSATDDRLERAVADVLAHGGTSGADLATGFILALERVYKFMHLQHKETGNGA